MRHAFIDIGEKTMCSRCGNRVYNIDEECPSISDGEMYKNHPNLSKTPPVTGQIEARLREILAEEYAALGFDAAACSLREGRTEIGVNFTSAAIKAMSRAYALDRASGDGVRVCKDGREFVMELATIMGVVDVCGPPDVSITVSELMLKMLARAKEDRERWHTPCVTDEMLTFSKDMVVYWTGRGANNFTHHIRIAKEIYAALSAVSIPQENWKRPEPVEFTIIEGGHWHPWAANMTFKVNDRNFHAIKFSDGSVFDMVNGWRK